MVIELARRLGEQATEKSNDSALVRRLAMRLRSLPLDRVVGALSPAARQLLRWMAEQGAEVSLPTLHKWSGSELLLSDPWLVTEELYRAGLIDIGRREGVPADMPLQSIDLLAVVPTDLCSRFRSQD
jgi:hypothetical protein